MDLIHLGCVRSLGGAGELEELLSGFVTPVAALFGLSPRLRETAEVPTTTAFEFGDKARLIRGRRVVGAGDREDDEERVRDGLTGLRGREDPSSSALFSFSCFVSTSPLGGVVSGAFGACTEVGVFVVETLLIPLPP